MDIFSIHQSVLEEYRKYVSSFLAIADDRIRDLVEDELLNRGAICPDALVQLNPGFAIGPSVEHLVDEGVLHPLCSAIFRDQQGNSIRLYRHQEEAIRKACERS